MKDKLLHPATFISLIALFIALSGSAYAVSQLPKNSVGQSQLRKDSVTSRAIKNGAVAEKDLSKGVLSKLSAKSSSYSKSSSSSAATASSRWGVRSVAIVNTAMSYNPQQGFFAKSTTLGSESDSDWISVTSPKVGVYCLAPEQPLRGELLNDSGQAKRPVIVWSRESGSSAADAVSFQVDGASGPFPDYEVPFERFCPADTLQVVGSRGADSGSSGQGYGRHSSFGVLVL